MCPNVTFIGSFARAAVERVAGDHISRLELADTPRPGRAARRHTRATLRTWGVEDTLIDDCELVVAELVSNAERHAAAVVSLWLERCYGDLLVIAVQDRSPGRVPQVRPGSSGVSGRGMHLVASMSERHGWITIGDSKFVWATLLPDGRTAGGVAVRWRRESADALGITA